MPPRKNASQQRGSAAVPEAFQQQLIRLFGLDSSESKRKTRTKAEWRRTLRKILAEIHRYQTQNVQTDRYHELWLAGALTSADRAISHEEDFWPSVCEALSRYALVLMGEYPNHARRKSGRRTDDHYRLDRLRSLTFRLDDEQRFRVLYEAVDAGVAGTKKKMWELLEPFYQQHGYRAPKRIYLQWFREKYPSIYLRVF